MFVKSAYLSLQKHKSCVTWGNHVVHITYRSLQDTVHLVLYLSFIWFQKSHQCEVIVGINPLLIFGPAARQHPQTTVTRWSVPGKRLQQFEGSGCYHDVLEGRYQSENFQFRQIRFSGRETDSNWVASPLVLVRIGSCSNNNWVGGSWSLFKM
jgi:hypothetical protein